MANTRISDLTASASNLASTDLAPVVQTTGVGPVKMTGLQLAGGLLGSATFNGATVTTSSPVLNLTQTWNAAGVTFTGLKFNATDTASASGSLLLDLQVGGTNRFRVLKSGSVFINNPVSAGCTLSVVGAFGGSLSIGYGTDVNVTGALNNTTAMRLDNGATPFFFSSAGSATVSIDPANSRIGFGSGNVTTFDAFLTRAAAATLQLGAADAAAPVAQTFKVQGVVAGTTNTAGANFTIRGSQGTGTGAGGSIIFQVAPAGSTGSSQNAYSTALTIAGSGTVTITTLTVLQPFAAGYGSFNVSSAGESRASLGSATYIGFTSTLDAGSTTPDTRLFRDAAYTLALRNGTNAQRFNVYNTYTSSTNYETFKIDWITTANTCLIGTEKGSGGGTARALALQTDGTTRLTISTAGVATFTSNVIADLVISNQGYRAGSGTGDTFFYRQDVNVWQIGREAQNFAQNGTLTVSLLGVVTDVAGGSLTLAAGRGRGTGGGGNLTLQTAPAGTTGTTQNTLLDREIIVAKGTTLTDNTATSLFEIALPTLAMAGGVIEATVICTDGTDMQAVTETITYAAVNKGGVYTKDVDVQTTSSAVSAGTITNTWAFLDGTNKVTMQVTSDTSLTPTKFLVYYKVRNNSEQATTIL